MRVEMVLKEIQRIKASKQERICEGGCVDFVEYKSCSSEINILALVEHFIIDGLRKEEDADE